MSVISPCRLCGATPELIDDRLVFFVRCKRHAPPWLVVYGTSYRHLDGIEDVNEAQAAIDAVDWASAEQSAIDAWNLENNSHD